MFYILIPQGAVAAAIAIGMVESAGCANRLCHMMYPFLSGLSVSTAAGALCGQYQDIILHQNLLHCATAVALEPTIVCHFVFLLLCFKHLSFRVYLQ